MIDGRSVAMRLSETRPRFAPGQAWPAALALYGIDERVKIFGWFAGRSAGMLTAQHSLHHFGSGVAGAVPDQQEQGATQPSRSAEASASQRLEDGPQFKVPESSQSPLEKEEDVWSGRTSWKHFAGRLFVWAVIMAVFGVVVVLVANRVTWLSFWRGLGVYFVGLLVSGAIVGGRILVQIMGSRYRLTSQRLFLHRGILRQTVDQVELIRVDDVSIEMSFVQRVLGVGSVHIVSTDSSDRRICLRGIESPETVVELVRDHTRILRRKSLFVESL